MEFISEELKNYLLKYCDPEDEILRSIDRETNLKVTMPRMLSGHYQGRVLSMLSKLIKPDRILEIGTYTGYATICLAEGLNINGVIHTIDINAELEDMVRTSFAKSNFNEKIVYHIGDAARIIPQIEEVFDMVFIDADKKNNSTYYNLMIEKLRPGGVIIVDNVLWSGKILEEKIDSNTAIIANFNKMVSEDQRVEKLILPVRDGLFIIRKK